QVCNLNSRIKCIKPCPIGERVFAPHLRLMYRFTYEHGINLNLDLNLNLNLNLNLSRSGKPINNARIMALAIKELNSALFLSLEDTKCKIDDWVAILMMKFVTALRSRRPSISDTIYYLLMATQSSQPKFRCRK